MVNLPADQAVGGRCAQHSSHQPTCIRVWQRNDVGARTLPLAQATGNQSRTRAQPQPHSPVAPSTGHQFGALEVRALHPLRRSRRGRAQSPGRHQLGV